MKKQYYLVFFEGLWQQTLGNIIKSKDLYTTKLICEIDGIPQTIVLQRMSARGDNNIMSMDGYQPQEIADLLCKLNISSLSQKYPKAVPTA